MSIAEMAFGPKFTDLHSSPKDRQLQKSCVSFGEECNEDQTVQWMNGESTERQTHRPMDGRDFVYSTTDARGNKIINKDKRDGS